MQNLPEHHEPAHPPAHYTQAADGTYAFHAFGRELTSGLPAVALLFDHVHGALINHGQPAFVRQRMEEVQRMYITGGLATDNIVMLEGGFPLDELNAVINVPRRISDLYAKHMEQVGLRAAEVTQALFSRIATGVAFAATR